MNSFEKHGYFKISCFVMFVLEISLNPPPRIADVLDSVACYQPAVGVSSWIT